MPRYLHSNNATAGLRDAITAASTTVRVSAGLGTLFPNPGTDEAFYVTVEDRRSGRIEIMLCTQRTTDTLTVTRGQQGTVAQSFPVGVNVSNRITAQILNDFVEATVDVIPLARIPTIPDSKISSLNASKLTGTINAGRLPNIPSANLTSVPAASLTGLIALARIPVLTLDKLPDITAAKIVSVNTSSFVGDPIPLHLIPELPSGKITSLSTGKLVGPLLNAQLDGNSYTGLVNFTGTGTSNFHRFVASDIGAQGDPAFTFSDATHAGIYYSANNGVAITVSNSLRLLITANNIRAVAGTSFQGSGADLNNIPASAINSDSTAINWVAALRRDAPLFLVGDIGYMHYSGSDLAPGAVVSGQFLVPSNAAGSTAGSTAQPSSQTWRCLGFVPSSASDVQKTTAFRRLT